jgi:DNA-directed RNA polymerase specialized sigma24 family protein
MHELDDVPMTEVASVLSIPLFTAYSRLRKARRELQAGIRRLLREVGRQ